MSPPAPSARGLRSGACTRRWLHSSLASCLLSELSRRVWDRQVRSCLEGSLFQPDSDLTKRSCRSRSHRKRQRQHGRLGRERGAAGVQPLRDRPAGSLSSRSLSMGMKWRDIGAEGAVVRRTPGSGDATGRTIAFRPCGGGFVEKPQLQRRNRGHEKLLARATGVHVASRRRFEPHGGARFASMVGANTPNR